MDVVFFTVRSDEALAAASSDELPVEPAAEALRVPDAGALAALIEALEVSTPRPLSPVRDATCRSFPVWAFAPECSDALRRLDARDIDRVCERWRDSAGGAALGSDLYELASCLAELRDALLRADPSEQLFALLEERAL